LLKPLAITTYRSISSSNGFHQVSNNSCASYKVSKCFSHNIARLRYQSQPFFIHYFSVTVFGVIVKNERAKYKTINCRKNDFNHIQVFQKNIQGFPYRESNLILIRRNTIRCSSLETSTERSCGILSVR